MRISLGVFAARDWKNQDDPTLMRACQQGQADACSELIERSAGLALSIPLACGLTAEEAEHLANSVLRGFFRQLDDWRDSTPVVRRLIDLTYREMCRRRGAQDQPSESGGAQVPVEEPSAEQIRHWEQAYRAHLALHQLGPQCRELLEALFPEGEGQGPVPSTRRWSKTSLRCLRRFAERLRRLEDE